MPYREPAVPRPADLFDRETEWAELARFATDGDGATSLGIVSGRRRQGKSFLLDRLCHALGGLHFQAIEETREAALASITAAMGAQQRLTFPVDTRFPDWPSAIRALADMAGGRPIVLDEVPYLLRASPELASAIQLAVDQSRLGRHPWFRLILCGSALSVMSRLLVGSEPLRGRAALQLMVPSFDFRQARAYWRIDDLPLAFHIDAILGGAPGYRDLVHGWIPGSIEDLRDWLAATVLNPSHALFHEAELLLTEDPALADRALYHSLVASVARGHATKSRVASDLGRKESSLDHPIGQLERAGFIIRDRDLLRANRPLLRVADPIIRFSSAVLRRDLARFERRDTAAAWSDADARFTTLVLGPHFETMTRSWTARHASARTLGGVAREVGFVQVHDPTLRQAFELDVAVQGVDPDGVERILAVGEAKGGTARRTLRDLQRLQRLRVALGARADVSRTKLLLFGRSGFEPDVIDAARTSGDVELVDLDRLYEGD